MSRESVYLSLLRVNAEIDLLRNVLHDVEGALETALFQYKSLQAALELLGIHTIHAAEEEEKEEEEDAENE